MFYFCCKFQPIDTSCHFSGRGRFPYRRSGQRGSHPADPGRRDGRAGVGRLCLQKPPHSIWTAPDQGKLKTLGMFIKHFSLINACYKFNALPLQM